MVNKFKFVFASIFGLLIFGGAYLAFQAFAEGDVNCSIQITGHAKNTNPNAGDTTFDSHWVDVEGENVVGGITASLKILGIDTPGLVPYWSDPAYQHQRQFAACAEEERDVSGKIIDVGGNKIPDKYLLKGFMWNDNIGYISLSCQDGYNEGVPCGGFNYGVFTDEPIPNGPNVKLKGYAWNPVFGYINFNCSGGAVGGSTGIPGDLTNCGIIPYGVTMAPGDADGNGAGSLSGYAYSQAGIYLGFSGVNVAIKGVKDVPPIEIWCDGPNWTGACVEVNVEGALLPDSGPKLADGADGYTVNLYLRDSNKQPASLDDFDVTMKFFWDDTVKKDQTSGYIVGSILNAVQNPWSQGGFGNIIKGAVKYKPINVNDVNFQVVAGEPGHYQLNTKISSYAPTRDGNTSKTTSTDPALNFQNEVFLNKVDGIPSDQEANYLKLKRVEYSLKKAGVDVVPPNSIIYANGKLDLSLSFEPVYSFETLYADDRQDAIKAFRSVPTIFKVKAVEGGDSALLPDAGSVWTSLALAYDSTKTTEKCGQDYPGGVVSNFDFHFSDPEGELATRFDDGVNGIIINEKDEISQTFNKFKNLGAFDLPAEATLDEDGGPDVQLCGFVQAPSLYTKVWFTKDGKNVKYYANKLPRLGGDVVANPAIVVHGNVYSQYSCAVNASIAAVSPVGDQTISSVKNAIDKNVKSYGGAINDDTGNNPSCDVTSLGGDDGCRPDKKFEVKGDGDTKETVLYYKNTNVHLSSGSWNGAVKYALIVDGGNLYIDGDLYNSSGGQLAIAVFKKTPEAGNADTLAFSKSGNVFIDTAVRNIQASLIADGSIFSNMTGVNYETLLNDGNLNELNNYFVNLSGNSYQLLWEGGVSARNSIGGADLCGKSSYFFRGNETTQNKKLAQLYDLNYLRLFRLDLETFNGLPIDQVCGKALNIEDMVAILNGEQVYGDEGTDYPCNGIDPFHAFDSRDGYGYDEGSGDLVPAASEDKLVEAGRWPSGGDDGTSNYNPVYIFYKASDSFLFRTK